MVNSEIEQQWQWLEWKAWPLSKACEEECLLQVWETFLPTVGPTKCLHMAKEVVDSCSSYPLKQWFPLFPCLPMWGTLSWELTLLEQSGG